MIARRLITALALAICIAGFFTLWLSRKFGGYATPSTRRYVTTDKNLEAGELLRPDSVSVATWSGATPLEGAFARSEEVLGRTVLYPLAKGQPVLERQLYSGTGSGMSTKIPDDMRAISLKSDQVVGVAGFLFPGTHIDVLVTYHTFASSDPVTSTVLQDVQILAAGQKMQPDPDGKASTVDVVTLLVTPQDAEKAVLASAQGTVHFVLRNGIDHRHVSALPIRLADLAESTPQRYPLPLRQPSGEPAKSKPALPARYSIQVLRGDKQTVETF